MFIHLIFTMDPQTGRPLVCIDCWVEKENRVGLMFMARRPPYKDFMYYTCSSCIEKRGNPILYYKSWCYRRKIKYYWSWRVCDWLRSITQVNRQLLNYSSEPASINAMLSFSLSVILLICCNSNVITMQLVYYFVYFVYVDFNS